MQPLSSSRQRQRVDPQVLLRQKQQARRQKQREGSEKQPPERGWMQNVSPAATCCAGAVARRHMSPPAARRWAVESWAVERLSKQAWGWLCCCAHNSRAATKPGMHAVYSSCA